MEIIFPQETTIPLGMRAFAQRVSKGDGEPRFRNSTRTPSDATYKVETYFNYTSNGNSIPVPCTVKFTADKKTKLPYRAMMVTPFGRALITLTPNEKGIPLPSSIYFHAHDYVSSQISYKDPLMIRAKLGDEKHSECQDVDPEWVGYNPEKGFAAECEKSQSGHGVNDDFSSEAETNNDSREDGFRDIQRFYIVSKRPYITELIPHTEYKDGTPHVVYGPETKQVKSNECLYSKEVQSGMWITATPSNSEVEPRSIFEERMLRLHIHAFAQIAEDSVVKIINLLKEDSSIGQN